MRNFKTVTRTVVPLVILASVAACSGGKSAGSITPQQLTDSLHTVLSTDRAVYTKLIVNRLQNEEKIIKATEHWKEEKTLVLPAQMFRAGAEMVRDKGATFSYSLLSTWPINKQNAPKTEAEKTGLDYIVANKGKNYYTEETLGGKKYFTAVYPDPAVAPACVTCHNDHKDSPKKDFKLGDTMGGVVIRVPMGS
jgi:Protein of unknown function (DUF3365)